MHDVAIGKNYALLGQPVDVGRLYFRGAVVADVVVAEVIDEDEDDVRPEFLAFQQTPRHDRLNG